MTALLNPFDYSIYEDDSAIRAKNRFRADSSKTVPGTPSPSGLRLSCFRDILASLVQLNHENPKGRKREILQMAELLQKVQTSSDNAPPL